MRVEGVGEFNPDMDGGVKLTRESMAKNKGGAGKDADEKKKGCC